MGGSYFRCKTVFSLEKTLFARCDNEQALVLIVQTFTGLVIADVSGVIMVFEVSVVIETATDIEVVSGTVAVAAVAAVVLVIGTMKVFEVVAVKVGVAVFLHFL